MLQEKSNIGPQLTLLNISMRHPGCKASELAVRKFGHVFGSIKVFQAIFLSFRNFFKALEGETPNPENFMTAFSQS